MNHDPTAQQKQQIDADAARRYYSLLTDIAEQIAALEEQIPALTVHEFNDKKLALERLRDWLKSEWDRIHGG